LDGDNPNTIIAPKKSYFRRFGLDFFSLYARKSDKYEKNVPKR
jgi:hypothetical protein